MFIRKSGRFAVPPAGGCGPVVLLAALCLLAGAPVLAQQPAAAPRYSLSIPSFDEIPLDVIPPAPAPVKRQPPKPAPVAKSPEEQAAYDKIGKEQRPDERIKLVEDFLLAYPDSEFKQSVYLAAADSYRRKNDLPRMLTYAELTLAEDPENLQALLTLAEALPESVRRDDPDFVDRIDEAAEYAHKALDLASRMARPANATAEQWQRLRKQVEVAARLALALTAMMREEYPAAEAEYVAAFGLMERPDALSLYRLGLTYSLQKKYDEALSTLRRAVEAGGVRGRTAGGEPRELAAEALAYVEKEVEKQKAAVAVPAPATADTPTPADAKDTQAGQGEASAEPLAQ
jgi:tetratricopeptide (TPR) repeat protein